MTDAGSARRLEDKVAVVVGAGGVLGEAVVARFLAEGATVVGIDRNRIDSDDIDIHELDVREEQAVIDAVAAIVARHGRIDVLYNNVGPLDPDDHGLEQNSVDTWEQAFQNLLMPVVLACKHVVPVMREAGRGGSIINTGSFLAGMGAATAQTAFSAAKAAVIQTSRDLGIHLAKTGIRVNSLSIGPVETPQSKAMFEKVGPAGLKERLGHVPTGRFATPAEIAGIAAFLASDDSGYLTATDIQADGGIRGAYTIPD
jgi:NAD(P)-dependent dehydrogenase (short-subunit alcohol dehydrogenase family)